MFVCWCLFGCIRTCLRSCLFGCIRTCLRSCLFGCIRVCFRLEVPLSASWSFTLLPSINRSSLQPPSLQPPSLHHPPLQSTSLSAQSPTLPCTLISPPLAPPLASVISSSLITDPRTRSAAVAAAGVWPDPSLPARARPGVDRFYIIFGMRYISVYHFCNSLHIVISFLECVAYRCIIFAIRYISLYHFWDS